MKSITIKKSILIVSFILILIIILMPKSLAGINPSQITGQAPGGVDIDKSFLEKLVEVIRFIGTFIAVGAMMVIGIKYMAGSIEEKATYKKSMLPYLIGCVLLFGASTIAPQIVEIFKENDDMENIGNMILSLIYVIRNICSNWHSYDTWNKILTWKSRRKSKLQKINVTLFDRSNLIIWSS